MQCFPRVARATSKQQLPSENKMAALNLQVYKCFFQVYLKNTESKGDENYTAGNRNAVEIP